MEERFLKNLIYEHPADPANNTGRCNCQPYSNKLWHFEVLVPLWWGRLELQDSLVIEDSIAYQAHLIRSVARLGNFQRPDSETPSSH